MLANNSKTYHTNKFWIKIIQRSQDKIFKIIGAQAVHALRQAVYRVKINEYGERPTLAERRVFVSKAH